MDKRLVTRPGTFVGFFVKSKETFLELCQRIEKKIQGWKDSLGLDGLVVLTFSDGADGGGKALASPRVVDAQPCSHPVNLATKVSYDSYEDLSGIKYAKVLLLYYCRHGNVTSSTEGDAIHATASSDALLLFEASVSFCVYQGLAVTDIACAALNGKEMSVLELLESFGPLRGFDLVKGRETGNSKRYAFCVYQDLTVTDIACAALNGIKMGDKTLTVRRATRALPNLNLNKRMLPVFCNLQSNSESAYTRRCAVWNSLLGMGFLVNVDELKVDEDYEDVIEDRRTECGKFGRYLEESGHSAAKSQGEPTPGLGKVFLQYVDVDDATNARQGLNGRKFDGNQVVAVSYPKNKFAEADYDC
ncbi:hypothetical protein RHSIM_Rhsim08G0113300 [Rhododendron simsii]|uniref:RRM domain-containing protein n=1 Tax=Rhododendron simsii TaxID=118357 RepID=A0A834GHI7_RHOSS|nr:hypothetical protein RHSIM_Rhsim08G0113300 [Rhododendron simsii]